MEIISGHMHGLVLALKALGITKLNDAIWIRQPVRINGIWRAKVKV